MLFGWLRYARRPLNMQADAPVVDYHIYLTLITTLRKQYALALVGLVSFSMGWLLSCEAFTWRPQRCTLTTSSLEGQRQLTLPEPYSIMRRSAVSADIHQ